MISSADDKNPILSLYIDGNARIFAGTIYISYHWNSIENKIMTDIISSGTQFTHSIYTFGKMIATKFANTQRKSSIFFFTVHKKKKSKFPQKNAVKVNILTSSFNVSHSVYWPRMVNERVARGVRKRVERNSGKLLSNTCRRHFDTFL